jgi:thiol-disulfide isomerase/thioredoxin
VTKPTRAQRRAAARQPGTGPSASRWLLPAAGLVLVAVGALAFVLSQDGPGTGAVASPSAAASTGPSSSAVTEAGPPVITGTSLPAFTGTPDDPAKGLAAPVVQGHDHQGNPVAIAPNGRIQMVIFAAHWCPHCQREIPLLQDWVDGGGLPDDVDIVTVSTGIDPTAPNYPPDAWFEREGWTAPIIVDGTNSVAKAYGLASYPYFVILDGAGDVVVRLVGEIPTADLEQVLATVPRS